MAKQLIKTRRTNRETVIENAIMAHREQLGFPDALAIRNCRIALPSGAVDVVLLPRSGRIKLVLVETKVSSAADAGSKVIGQLFMYYAGALSLGANGLELMRQFAEQNPGEKCKTKRISPKALVASKTHCTRNEAWDALSEGEKLQPEQIQLFIALDGEPHRALEPTLDALKHHGIAIGLITFKGDKFTVQRTSKMRKVP